MSVILTVYIYLFIFSGFFITSIVSPVSFLDAAESWQVGFQEAATPIMEGIIKLHDDVMLFLVFIAGVVF